MISERTSNYTMAARHYSIPLAALLLLVIVCIGTVLLMHLSYPGPQYIDAPLEMQESSQEFASDVQAHTSNIESVLKNLSGDLTGLTPDDPRAGDLIRTYYDQYPDAAGIVWVDANGSVCREPVYSMSVLLAAPEIAALNESSFAEHDVLMIGPLVSQTYGMVLCFAVPVYAEDKTYNGFVCIAHLPALLLNETPGTPYFKETDYELWVINDDGTYLYHPDAGLIGQNIYTDPMFVSEPSVLTGVRAVVEKPSGAMNYTGYDLSCTEVVEKTGVWTTVSFGGQDIRLVLDDYSYDVSQILFPDTIVTPDNLKSIAESMLVYAFENGRELTLNAMNNPSGPFATPGYDVFAFSMNGTLLSMPSQTYGVGMDRTNYRDAYSMLSVTSMINRCMQGGGYVHYYLKYPYTDEQARLGLAYVMPVDENWFIGVDGPVQDHSVTYDMTKRTEVVHTVQAAQEYVLAFGREAALAKMMDATDPLVKEDTHLFALDYNGTLLADETNRSNVGKDVFYHTDSYGNSPIREVVMVARTGGGYLYIESENPVTHQHMLYLTYVEPVNDTWCIASAISLDAYDVSAGSAS